MTVGSNEADELREKMKKELKAKEDKKLRDFFENSKTINNLNKKVKSSVKVTSKD